MNFYNINSTDFVKGQKLFVTLLDNRNLEANFNRLSQARRAIVLRNVSFVAEDKKPFEQLEIKLDDIAKIACLELENKVQVAESKPQVEDQELKCDVPAPSPACESNGLGLLYEKLKELVQNHIFIDQLDDKFQDAVRSLEKEHTVAVVGEGSALGRFSHLVVLGIATRHNVYVFDLVNLGARTFKEHRNFLKKFLQCRNVLKVVHDCRFLADCLRHKYDIDLQNVFDTQACHVLVHKHQSGELPFSGGFSQLVSQYLKLPGDMFETKGVSLDTWRRRPLAEGLSEKTAWRTALIRELKPKLDDAYYAPFDQLCYRYLNSVREMDDDLEVKTLMQNYEKDKVPNHIINEMSNSTIN